MKNLAVTIRSLAMLILAVAILTAAVRIRTPLPSAAIGGSLMALVIGLICWTLRRSQGEGVTITPFARACLGTGMLISLFAIGLLTVKSLGLV